MVGAGGQFEMRSSHWMHKMIDVENRTHVSFFLPQTDEIRTNRTSVLGLALELAWVKLKP